MGAGASAGRAAGPQHGVDGLLVDDPTDHDAVAGCLIEALAQVLGQVERWLEELSRACERRRETGTG